ncbi:uncharacterized protein LOC124367281 isoform X2 [Homalodisca vitripennis]|uniref:uncharacterized protein LOC124367281 isoform X2 n=1 Tax=Homalodisca vitripennis TaxID=197043 RepID=UPI001EEAFA62|nr:uncharacterized protein LOC124367281 isoform X2 [Homalodisca vitripennis]
MRLVATLLLLCLAVVCGDHNLSCYQCTRSSNVQCGPESLLPCASNRDRCVTQITKDATSGYQLKRECGLGPCQFEDEMISRGLGIFSNCDTSKDEFFCVSCCKASGCNKDSAASVLPSSVALLTATGVHLALQAGRY